MTQKLYPLDQEAWNAWVAYRRLIKKPLNPDNYVNTMRGLQRFGENQMAVVQQSMEREYQGLFPVKDDGGVPMNDVKAPW